MKYYINNTKYDFCDFRTFRMGFSGFSEKFQWVPKTAEDFRHGFEVVSTTRYFIFILFLFRMFYYFIFILFIYLFIYCPHSPSTSALRIRISQSPLWRPFLVEVTIKPWHSDAKITKGRIAYVVFVTLYERSAGYYFILKPIIPIPSPNTAVSKEVQHCRSE